LAPPRQPEKTIEDPNIPASNVSSRTAYWKLIGLDCFEPHFLLAGSFSSLVDDPGPLL